jgi:hypothetical protein
MNKTEVDLIRKSSIIDLFRLNFSKKILNSFFFKLFLARSYHLYQNGNVLESGTINRTGR